MPVYVVRTKDKPEVRKWFSDTERRSKEESLIKNPIKWDLKIIDKGKDVLMVCDAQPVIPHFWVFGWITALAILCIWGVNAGFWIFVSIGCLGYFWSGDFFYRMTVMALRKKAGYVGPIKRVKLDEFIRGVVL